MTTPSASSDWMYRLFGEEFGPVDQATLQSLYEQGTLGDADEVRRVSSPHWLPYARALLAEETEGQNVAAQNDDPDQEPAWFYRMGHEDLGPLTFVELGDLAQQGVLTRDCEVKFRSTGKYRRAASIGRLAAHLPYAEIARPRPKSATPDPAATSPASSVAKADETPAPSATVVRYHPSAEELTWYAWIRGVEYGPASLVQLLQWVQSGQMSATDFVKFGVYGNWLPPTPTIEQALAPLTFVEAVNPAVQTATPAPIPSTQAATPAVVKVNPATATAVPDVSKPAAPATAAPVPTPVASAAPSVTASAQKSVASAPAAGETARTENPMSPPSKPVVESKPTVEAAEEKGPGLSASQSRPAPPAAPMNVTRPAPRPMAKSSAGGSNPFKALANPKILGGAAAVLVVGGLVWGMLLLPAGTGAERADLVILQDVLNKFRSLRESKAAESEWLTFSEATKNSVAPMVERLKTTADRDHQYRQYLLWAARDRLPQMLGDARLKPSPAEDEFEYNIQKAAFLMKQGPDPDLSRSAPAGAAD